jgi:radical SAM protein with 4Fe4S-binding SPASM domain
MSSLHEWKKRLFSSPRWEGRRAALPQPPQTGIYHFERRQDGEKARLHLRLEADGRGVLLVNASRSYHLNPTAAWMAYLALQDTPAEKAAQIISARYRIPKRLAAQDYANFLPQLAELIRPDGACPVCDLQLDILAPFSQTPSAPYRMDLALTYRCNNDCAHCYNARPRQSPELSTAQWKDALDRLWQLGIPHVVFTGGEPTLRPDLPELIAHAEANGQITGLNTNGRRLKDAKFLQRLVDAGLDHVQITFESHDAIIHDQMVNMPGAWLETIAGLRNALETRLYVMTNTTMLQNNSPVLDQTLAFLADLKVPTIGLNALIYSGAGQTVGSGIAEAELKPLLQMARRATEKAGQRLIWYTPTQYCQFDPMQLELGVKGCSAALYAMCTEPDGSVIPCQSYYRSLGNLISDPWDQIWNHPLAVSLRQRNHLSGACLSCLILADCRGGCPLVPEKPVGYPLPIRQA